MRKADDRFIYEPVVVPSIEDAVIAVLFNHNIQSVIIRPGLDLESSNQLPVFKRYPGESHELMS